MGAMFQRWRMLARQPLLKRMLTLAFLAAVAFFVAKEAHQVDWLEVRAALSGMSPSVVAMAMGFALASHLLVSCFDLTGRYYVHSRLPVSTVMMVNFVSYAFNLSFGAIVGALGFRYRLYTRCGMSVADVTRVISLSMLTNWIGHVLLGGVWLVWMPVPLPQEWRGYTWGLRIIGVALIALTLAYLAFCATARRREW